MLTIERIKVDFWKGQVEDVDFLVPAFMPLALPIAGAWRLGDLAWAVSDHAQLQARTVAPWQLQPA